MYDIFKTTEQAAKKYHRCRKNQYYILADDSPQLNHIICPNCKRTISDDPAELESYKGNRAIYYPKHKKSVVEHYECSWQSVFNSLFKVADYLY